MTSPFLPSSFSYNDAPAGGQPMPMVVAARNPSNTIDKQYPAGYLWLASLDQYTIGPGGVVTYGSGNLYYQAGNSLGVPNWVLISDSSGSIVGITGTANQIAVSITNGVATLSIPATFIAPGSIASTTTMAAGTALSAGTTVTATLGNITATNGNLVLGTAGNKLSINAGANGSVGTSGVLSTGTVTVATTAVTASSKIFLTRAVAGGTLGNLSVGTISAGVNFTITSDNVADTSTVNWIIIN